MKDSVSYSLFMDGEIGCGKCNKMFPYKSPSIINKKTDPQLFDALVSQSLLIAKCTFCGHSATYPAWFLFHDPDSSKIFFVLGHDYNRRYLFAKSSLKDRISEYKKNLPKSEHKIIDNIEIKIIRYELFLILINAKGTGGNSHGYLQFSPFPDISIPKGKQSTIEVTNESNTDDFCFGFINKNLPEQLNKIINLIDQELHFDRIYLPKIPISSKRKGVVTSGILEIVLFATTSILIPIIAGTLSNLLSTAITEKRAKRRELEKKEEENNKTKNDHYEFEKIRIEKLLEIQNNDYKPSDKLSVKIIDTNNHLEYAFEGSISEVTLMLKKLRKNSLLSLNLNGDCHVAKYYGNEVIDFFVSKKSFNIDDLESHYKKYMAKNTRVSHISNLDPIDYIEEYLIAAKIAKELMDQERYEDAIQILASGINDERATIDLLYNMAICAEKLGYEDAACDFYEDVIKRTINLPSLNESNTLITGLSNEESIEKTISKKLNQEDIEKYEKGIEQYKSKLENLRKEFNIENPGHNTQ